jgi:hypothetical protein
MPRMTAFERLNKKWILNEATGCWEWTASLTPLGYGRFSFRGKHPASAHRAAYILYVGEIPEGLSLDHLCRNPKCINPSHLEPVTHKENVLRGEGIAALNARKIECIRGHEFTTENTIIDGNRRQCRACKNMHNTNDRIRRRNLTSLVV